LVTVETAIPNVQLPSRREVFLGALQPNTRDTYRNGLDKFESYLKTLPEYAVFSDPLFAFLINVKKDRNLDVLEMKYEERKIIKGFWRWLAAKGYAPKSQLVHVAAVQSFGLYYQVPISTKFTDPPASTAVNEKCEWTLEMLGKFIESMESSFYQSLATSLLQCTLRLSDVIGENLPYKIIQKEFESGIVPVCILIKNSEKTLIRHRTFLGSLAVKKMKAYFEEEGTPKPDEPIYPISDRTVDEYFARTAKKMFPEWKGQNPYGPHSIRGAASTFLSDALCPESAIEYLGGHSLDKDVKLRYRRRSTERWRVFYKQFEWAVDYTVKPEDRPKTSISELKQMIDSFANADSG
jgi:hypothetical protein